MRHQLEADGIELEYSGRKILSSIYLKCETGKITGLLGRNGQGKSSLMKIIYGSLQVENKSIRFDRSKVTRALTRPDLIRYLPQFSFIPGFFKLKTVFRNFCVDFFPFAENFPEIKPYYNAGFNDLSGGQKRLVEVYIIIKVKTCFSMLDEPFSNLMPLHVEKIKEQLIEEKQKKGFLITDHLYQNIIDVSDDLYLLKDGKTHIVKNLADIETLGYARIDF